MRDPAGGNFLPPDMGLPVVYFPLTNRSLESWPPQADSWGHGADMVGSLFWGSRDDQFPYALWCDQGVCRAGRDGAGRIRGMTIPSDDPLVIGPASSAGVVHGRR